MARTSSSIVSLHCHHCGIEISPARGGLCGSCGEIYCHSCLFFEKGKKEKIPICINCKRDDAHYIRASRFFPAGANPPRKHK